MTIPEPPADPRPAADPNEIDLRQLASLRRAKVMKATVLGLIAVALIMLVIQNSTHVDVRLLFWDVSMRLIWIVVIATALGAVGGYLVGRPPKDLRLHGPRRRKEDPPPPPGQEPEPAAPTE